jgi:hypothetical protein
MKTMFPREFVIWKDRNIIYDKEIDCYWHPLQQYWCSFDKLYEYWRLEIEPKTKEDGKG